MDWTHAAPPTGEAEVVAAGLGSATGAIEKVGWGDAGATWRIALADGRQVAGRRLHGPDRSDRADRLVAVIGRAVSAGLPVPPMTRIDTADAVWLVDDWVDGETGAAWLANDDRARALAGAMGSLSCRLRALDTTGLMLSLETPSEAATQLADVRHGLAAPTVSALEAAIQRIGPGEDEDPGFIHGDFAPINVVMRDDGTVAALLDFEHARLGSRHSDIAWWGWVVRHHHPKAWAACWATFAAAAEVDPDAAAEHVRARVLIRLLEAAAGAADGAERGRWLRRLRETAAW